MCMHVRVGGSVGVRGERGGFHEKVPGQQNFKEIKSGQQQQKHKKKVGPTKRNVETKQNAKRTHADKTCKSTHVESFELQKF